MPLGVMETLSGASMISNVAPRSYSVGPVARALETGLGPMGW
jgi:hypothetical protein